MGHSSPGPHESIIKGPYNRPTLCPTASVRPSFMSHVRNQKMPKFHLRKRMAFEPMSDIKSRTGMNLLLFSQLQGHLMNTGSLDCEGCWVEPGTRCSSEQGP